MKTNKNRGYSDAEIFPLFSYGTNAAYGILRFYFY